MNEIVPSRKNPAQTRERLLGAAFAEIYTQGFQGSDLNGILSEAGVTKGALYHHFGSKHELGCAVVEEVVAGIMRDKWLAPLDDIDDPIETLIAVVDGTSFLDEHVAGGCPLNNLAQEMSNIDDDFRTRLSAIFQGWIDGVADALRLGKANGKVRRDVDPRQAATFLVATYEGYTSLAKNAQDARLLQSGVQQMKQYLLSLRP